MSLITVKEIGYGFKGDRLDLTIAIPKDSCLHSLWVCTQKDINTDCTTTIRGIGIDYVQAVQNYYETIEQETITKQEAFLKMFEFVESYTEESSSKIYDVYKLKSDFDWFTLAVSPRDIVKGIKVSNKNLTFITMELDADIDPELIMSTECGEDNNILTVPLYDILTLRLGVLRTAKDLKDSCSIPRIFIDKILQLKAIELAICCGEYCKALDYWKLFFNVSIGETVKRCGCNG